MLKSSNGNSIARNKIMAKPGAATNATIPEATRPTRIAVLNTHPIQYFSPLYAYLNAAPDLEVTALYLTDVSIRGAFNSDFGQEVKWDLDLLAGYDAKFLGKRAHTRTLGGFWSLVVPEIWSELRSKRYDVLWIHGHAHAANILGLIAAKWFRMPVMMRGDTHLTLPRKRLKAALRRPLLGLLYGLCDRLLAVGSANAAFYLAMGVPPHKIVLVPYTVDNDRFVRESNLSELEKADVRNQYRIPIDRPALLFAAKFTSRKRPADLLKAAAQLNGTTGKPFTIVMAGAGESEQSLRQYCTKASLGNVVFTGFINQSELPRLYAACDVFVLPSEHEPWGLAVNEAMCASLPIVISREVGCVEDLVENGINGFTPMAGDVDGLAAALRALVDDDSLRSRQRQASLSKISQWSHREALNGIRSALKGLRLRGR